MNIPITPSLLQLITPPLPLDSTPALVNSLPRICDVWENAFRGVILEGDALRAAHPDGVLTLLPPPSSYIAVATDSITVHHGGLTFVHPSRVDEYDTAVPVLPVHFDRGLPILNGTVPLDHPHPSSFLPIHKNLSLPFASVKALAVFCDHFADAVIAIHDACTTPSPHA